MKSKVFKCVCASLLAVAVLNTSFQSVIAVADEEETQATTDPTVIPESQVFWDALKSGVESAALNKVAGLIFGSNSPQAKAFVWTVQVMLAVISANTPTWGDSGSWDMSKFSGYCGKYTYSGYSADDCIMVVPMYPEINSAHPHFVVATCPQFEIYGDYEDKGNNSKYLVRATTINIPSDLSSSISFRYYSSNTTNFNAFRYSSPSVYTPFTNGNDYTAGSYGNLYVSFYASQNSVPNYSTGAQLFCWANYSGNGYYNPLCGNGWWFEMPEGVIDLETPWVYYNDVFLPYLKSEYPDVDFTDILVFPDGYDTSNVPGIDVTWNFPPSLPSPSFRAPEIPSQKLPEKMLSGASFWFTEFDALLDGFGIKWIVILFMIVALVMAILKI